jgi:hypothetical protein
LPPAILRDFAARARAGDFMPYHPEVTAALQRLERFPT